MDTGTAIALPLALASTALINVAYLREHDAAAQLPALSMRRPIQTARILVGDRAWLVGFMLETAGFAIYVVALALASLALVQSVGAGGVGILAYVSAKIGRRRLTRRELGGSIVATAGLTLLGISLLGGSDPGTDGDVVAIVAWLVATTLLALAVLALGRWRLDRAAAAGIAGGIFFSVGDVATKAATHGGTRIGFAVGLVLGYTAGTALLQVGYQAGAALTVAGLATLLTNALPIAAGAVVFAEPVPSGAYGALRILAFAFVVVGAFLLARPEKQ